MESSELYKKYSVPIRNYLTKFVGEDYANDLTQEVFLKVDRNIELFRGDANIKTWIYSIATNTARDYLKSNKHIMSAKQRAISEEELLTYGVSQDDQVTPESEALCDEMNKCIREFIHRLPYSYSTVLVLSELEGYRVKEIAEILDISTNTAKVRLYRARAALKKEMECGCIISQGPNGKLICERR